jgi:hypothetical protein
MGKKKGRKTAKDGAVEKDEIEDAEFADDASSVCLPVVALIRQGSDGDVEIERKGDGVDNKVRKKLNPVEEGVQKRNVLIPLPCP